MQQKLLKDKEKVTWSLEVAISLNFAFSTLQD